jgi:hypothetical protein
MRCHVQKCDKPLPRTAIFRRLMRLAGDVRKARQDRKLLLGFNSRMLQDIGLVKDEFSSSFALLDGSLSGHRRRTGPAMRFTLLTLSVVICAMLLAVVTPEPSRLDFMRVTSCALFPEGATFGGYRLPPRNACRPR